MLENFAQNRPLSEYPMRRIAIVLIVLVGVAGFFLLTYGWYSRHDTQIRSAMLPIESAKLEARTFEKTGSGLVVIRGFSLWLTGVDGTRYRCHAGKVSLLCRPDASQTPEGGHR